MHQTIFSHIPDNLPEESIEALLNKGNTRIERISSRGHASTEWYDQDHDESAIILKGEAKLRFERTERIIHSIQETRSFGPVFLN